MSNSKQNISKERNKKCELSQLWSMGWCGERPFGHQASHHFLIHDSTRGVSTFLTSIIKFAKKHIFGQIYQVKSCL